MKFNLYLNTIAFLVSITISTGVLYAQESNKQFNYLEEPETPPEPSEVTRQDVRERNKDETTRIERTVAKLSDDTFMNDGKYIEYYLGGEKFVEGAFNKGIHDGDWTYWHPNGQLCKKITYKKGLPHGSWDVLGPDGKLTAKKNYDNGKRIGTWVIYFEDGKQKKLEINYVDGKLHGERIVYHQNGQKRQAGYYKAGLRDGVATEWDETGKKTAEVKFVDGKRDGKVIRFD